MARRNKLLKFSQIAEMPNVYQNFNGVDPTRTDEVVLTHQEDEVHMQGRWSSHFGNDHPLVLELACGRGEYSLALGAAHPSRNYIGVDIKGARIWQGAKSAIDQGLENVAFLRTRIEMIHFIFGAKEIDEVWITFPDPFLRDSKSNRRLTSPAFLDLYRRIVKPGGIIHLKTDDDTLYDFTVEEWSNHDLLEVVYQERDIYSGPLAYPELAHETYYERLKGKGKTIKYIRAKLLP